MTTQFISTHHAECFNSFTALLANPPALGGADGTVPTGEITEEFNRYRIWADNVGAGQYGANYKLSLDYRLREALFYKDQVIKILQRLDNIIQKIREVRKGVGRNLYTDTESHSDTDDSDSQTGPDDFDSSEEHSDWAISSSEGEYEVPRRVVSGLSDRLSSKSLSEVPNEELAQLLNSLKLTIAALYKLPVRKPAPVNRLDRLTQTADQTSLYEHSDIMFVRDAFKEAHPDLVTRLGRMNTRRRRLLHYRRSHNEKLKREMVESQASQDEQAISALQPLAEFAAIPNQDAGEETATRSVAFKSQRNETSRATTFRPDPAQLLVPPLDDMDVQSLPQSVSSSPSSDAGKEFLVIPPRPRDAENTELVDFECPYCCVTCHIRGSHTWEKHIMRDLEAYVCTFNGCDRANDMFGNREDWYKHETQEHRFEYSCNTEGHERMNDVAEFRSHMDTEHNVKFRDDQLSSQLTMFARPTRQLSGICPLCNQAKSRLKRHLGRHLERIALFSLPRQVDTEDEPVSGSGNISVQIVHHSNVGEPPEETSQPEDAEDRSARSSSEEGNENGNNADPEASPISGGPPGTDYANMEQTEVPETTAFSWDYATQKFKDARKRPEAPGPELDISSPKAQIVRYGLTQVFAPLGGGKVDVVFVHGLYGAPDLTWTSEKSKVFWPQDLLPPVLEEEMARILVYGYDADITSFTDSTSRNKIYNHAEHLIAGLAANRRIRNATERPIIFVAHSLGGLLVKRALTYSSELRGNHTVHLRSIFVSTYGILFLGTPHASDLARWGTVLQNVSLAMLPLKFFRGNAEKVKALKQSNETMGNIDRQFGELMSRFHTYFFHELKPSDLAGQKVFVVSVESASPFILQDVERAGIPSDHAHLSKFESENSPGFDLVAEAIERYATEAPDVIATRWQLEKAEILAIKRNQLEELLPVRTGSNSQASPPNVDTTDELPPFSYGRRNTNIESQEEQHLEILTSEPEPLPIDHRATPPTQQHQERRTAADSLKALLPRAFESKSEASSIHREATLGFERQSRSRSPIVSVSSRPTSSSLQSPVRPPTSTHRLEDYTVGWICALPIELSMAIGMLDGNHASLAQPSNDSNNYTLGRIGEHNVAIACLPTGLNGTNSVASSAARIQQTFRSMRFFLLVGTGDGVPTVTDIRLGDIVVADPRELQGGAIQYVLQKSIQSSRIEKLYSLRDPPAEVLSAMSSLRARHLLEDTEVPRYLSEMTTRYPKMQKNISYPGQQHDLLFETSYRHQGVPGKCAECDHDRVISRSLRDENTPAIHYGRIASAADVISDGEIRDHLGILTHIACFETEAAGFPEDYPCLVIRGIHGYADSHASERWRPYAAATAAAYAKELLSIVPAHQNTPVKTTASSSRLFNMFRKPK